MFRFFLPTKIVRRFFLLALFSTYTYSAEDQAGSLKLGMTTALSGPSQYLGTSMLKGMTRFFNELNSPAGYRGIRGIRGRQIELIVKDDFYDPATAVINSIDLIENQQVVALVGNVGTPTFGKLWDDYYLNDQVAQNNKVALFGAFTGAGQLRESDKADHVFNYRASYDQEMTVIVDHIINQSEISPNRIAFLLQGELAEDGMQIIPDPYGESGYNSAQRALQSAPYFFESSQSLVKATYIRNQLETNEAIERILLLKRNEQAPQAIIIVGSYQASAHFIKFMHRLLPTTHFYNLSFAGAGELAKALSARKIEDRVYMTQVIPMLGDDNATNLPLDPIEREGYLAAQEFANALRSCLGSSDVDVIDAIKIRQALTSYFEFGESCPEDPSVSTQPTTGNQISQYVALTRLHKGGWVNTIDSPKAP